MQDLQLGQLDSRPTKGILPLQITAISRCGLLEIARIGAGLSYQDLGKRAGMPGAYVARILRGGTRKPHVERVARLWSVLWQALPATPSSLALEVLGEVGAPSAGEISDLPSYLTIEEAADLLKLKPQKVRRLIMEYPELRAVKIGKKIRVPRHTLNGFITDPRPIVTHRADRGIGISQMAAFFRVHPDLLRYAIRTGRLKAEQARRHAPVRIPVSEVHRVMQSGLAELKPLSTWNRRKGTHAPTSP
jgi:excisionase family DNA binding protein